MPQYESYTQILERICLQADGRHARTSRSDYHFESIIPGRKTKQKRKESIRKEIEKKSRSRYEKIYLQESFEVYFVDKYALKVII